MFGLLNFANVLPLKIFLKRSALTTYAKGAIMYHSDVPAKLNKALAARRIDKTISSSIISAKKCYFNAPVGICASSAVLSVLIKKAKENQNDAESDTSNALSRLLDVKGQVIIGDKALKLYCDLGKMSELRQQSRLFQPLTIRPMLLRSLYLQDKANKNMVFSRCSADFSEVVDMCSEWALKTGLPFVFARYSEIKPTNKRLLRAFAKSSDTINKRSKMAHYVQLKEAKIRDITPAELKEYFKYIYYKIGPKEKRALNVYLAKLRTLKSKNF